MGIGNTSHFSEVAARRIDYSTFGAMNADGDAMDRRAPFFAAAGLCTAALIGTRWLVRSSGGSAPPRVADTEDSMVGVLDARYFDTALHQRFALAQRRLQPISLVLVGIEGSHDDPARAIDSLVATLKFSVRESDTVCRTAPDRLAMILEDATEYGAIFAVERARNMLRDLGNDHEMVVGVASYPSHAMELDELVAQAEEALVRARLQPLSGFSVAEARP
jgi:diguanylate cyclase (GGDEF)-like protein